MKERLYYLLEQARSMQASTEEYDELLQLIRSDASGEVLVILDSYHANALFPAAGHVTEPHLPEHLDSSWDTLLETILTADKIVTIDKSTSHTRRPAYRWWAAAAALFFLVSAGAYFIFRTGHTNLTGNTLSTVVFDARPGTKKAVLTLSGGQQILLDSVSNGQLAQQGNLKIVKLSNGRIAYEQGSTGGAALAGSLVNILSTPRGGQYEVALPDGTTVWLNAASTLTYPTVFTSGQRKVELTGEGYFEVAQNNKMPFRVIAGNQTVEVLGTHFNINAYADEPLCKTSLLEGAVKVSLSKFKPRILHAGEEAVTSAVEAIPPAGDPGIRIVPADRTECVAWKNGEFSFRNADIRTVMRQLERWYDVDIKFAGKSTDIYFSGSTYMNKNLSEVLKVLELSGVRFKMEGKTLIVYP